MTNISKPTKLTPKDLRATIAASASKEKLQENTKSNFDSSKSMEGLSTMKKIKTLPPKVINLRKMLKPDQSYTYFWNEYL